MIIPIRNQPITFAPIESDTPGCGDDSRYCQLVRLNDRLCFQLKQSSCLPQILCNSDFSEFGTDLIAPLGDFDSPDDVDPIGDSYWSYDGSTWTYDTYGKRMCTIESHAGNALEFFIGGYGMNEDCTYVFAFEVSGYEAPEGDVSDQELIITLPDGTTQNVTANGAYSFSTDSGTSFLFTPGLNWNGCIDNTSLMCGGTCWEISPMANVNLGGTGICKTGITATTVTQSPGTLT